MKRKSHFNKHVLNFVLNLANSDIDKPPQRGLCKQEAFPENALQSAHNFRVFYLPKFFFPCMCKFP